ncbi:MAG: NG,NG-dimethylarginine dimethylaminohydrolase 1 [Gemmatimonadetes bacterium]|nr:NG,NG-dimethylarginine dimethylaminohydrolase 1 [Gemmatimonadota bacterium]
MTASAVTRLVAITHQPSPNMQQYERTYVGDEVIDYALALRQHAAYQEALRACGAEVVTLDVNRAYPDCVFVEDTAIVLDEVAVMMSMGAESRRREPVGMEPALREFRPIERVSLPATIDGGDVVRNGRSLYVGESPRTNAGGVSALRGVLRPYGYGVTGIPVHGCLHLKTACSALPDGRFLVNAGWIDVAPLPADRLIHVPASEPWAGDVLVIGERIIASDAFPETIRSLRREGFEVIPVSVSEFAKAEGGVTCLSLVFGNGG